MDANVIFEDIHEFDDAAVLHSVQKNGFPVNAFRPDACVALVKSLDGVPHASCAIDAFSHRGMIARAENARNDEVLVLDVTECACDRCGGR